VAAAAADVGDVDPGLQPFRQTGYQRQDHVQQCCVVHRRAGLGHVPVEVGVVLVGQPAAVPETLDDLLFNFAHHGNVLHQNGHVVRARSAGQDGSMLAGQPVRPGRRIIADHARRGHSTQPFAHIALVEVAGVGYLLAGGGRQACQRLEQAGLVPDAGQQCGRGIVQDAHEASGKSLGGLGVELRQ
jgi:hypothetical protein